MIRFAFMTAAMLALLTGTPKTFADRPPNIIFIMADDMGYGDLGCYGQKRIRTPQIDRLAEEGTRFTQYYAGSTVCAPSRSCLMTGQHTGHTTVRGNMSRAGQRVPLRDEDITVAEVLHTAGYATGVIGKWGLGEPDTVGIPNRQGFDFWFGYLNQRHAHNYYPDYLWRNQERYPLEGNRDGKQEQYSHDLFTREALAFIERNQDRPFFLYMAYTIPHAMMQVPDLGPYAKKDWPEAEKARAAMITRLDGDVGRLMALLRELKLDENTLVIFTSDNGPHSEGGSKAEFFDSNGPLRGIKRDLYEGGIRAPMIARWPAKIPAGRESDQVWASWDVLPTLAEVAGAKPPEKIDGISMFNALVGKPQRDHEYLYWEFHENGMSQAVRMGPWKAIRKHSPDAPIELYHLERDLGEKNNLADQEPRIVARMAQIMKEARTESKHWPTPAEKN